MIWKIIIATILGFRAMYILLTLYFVLFKELIT